MNCKINYTDTELGGNREYKTITKTFYVSDGRKNPNRKKNFRKIKDDHPEYLKVLEDMSKGIAKPTIFDKNIIAYSDGRIFSRYSNFFMKQNYSGSGYLYVCIKRDGRFKTTNSHRIIYTTFKGEIPPRMCINHIDGRKDNNDISNLEVVTYSENTIHSVQVLGNQTKITKEVLMEIKKRIILGQLGRDKTISLARQVGVHLAYMNKIIRDTRLSFYSELFGSSDE